MPPDVNKQRLELSQRLRKLLKKGNAVPNKPRLDTPNEPDEVRMFIVKLHNHRGSVVQKESKIQD